MGEEKSDEDGDGDGDEAEGKGKSIDRDGDDSDEVDEGEGESGNEDEDMFAEKNAPVVKSVARHDYQDAMDATLASSIDSNIFFSVAVFFINLFF